MRASRMTPMADLTHTSRHTYRAFPHGMKNDHHHQHHQLLTQSSRTPPHTIPTSTYISSPTTHNITSPQWTIHNRQSGNGSALHPTPLLHSLHQSTSHSATHHGHHLPRCQQNTSRMISMPGQQCSTHASHGHPTLKTNPSTSLSPYPACKSPPAALNPRSATAPNPATAAAAASPNTATPAPNPSAPRAPRANPSPSNPNPTPP
jgi:hypothetical protein